MADAAIRRVLSVTTDRLQRTKLLPACIEIMLSMGAIPARVGTDVLSALAAQARGAVALADGDALAALGALRHAWLVWQQSEVPYLAARARVLMGLACRALGDEDGGKLELDAARAVCAQSQSQSSSFQRKCP